MVAQMALCLLLSILKEADFGRGGRGVTVNYLDMSYMCTHAKRFFSSL